MSYKDIKVEYIINMEEKYDIIQINVELERIFNVTKKFHITGAELSLILASAKFQDE